MSDRPQEPPVLKRPGSFTSATGQATEVTPEAAIAAALRLEGALEGTSALRLAYLAAANQADGRLTLDAGAARYQVTFKKGVPHHVASSDAVEHVGAFLVRKGVVREEQVAEAETVKEGYGGDVVSALAALRIVDPARIFQVLQEHGCGLFARALQQDKGRWSWEPGAAAPGSSFPLGARFGMLCDAARRLDGLALRQRLAPRLALAPTPTGGRVPIGDLRLTAQEIRLAGMLDGSRTLGEVAQAAAGEGDVLLRVALLLGECDLLAWAPTPTATTAAKPTAPSPRPGASSPAAKPAAPAKPATTASAKKVQGEGGAPARPAPAARPGSTSSPGHHAPRSDLASLREALQGMAGADHFQVLGVKREAPLAQVKAAYFALARAWHPDASAPDDPPEARKVRADLFARIGEAWGVLSDEARRRQYLDELAGGAADLDVAAILEAENVFQRATVLVKGRQYPQALEEIEKAIKMNADEPEFFVWRAWVRFLLSQDRRQQLAESSQEIETALKRVPRCMAGWLFLGQMAKIAGDIPLAERHLRRGLAVDPENADLVREMKYLRK
ncbi:MAG TPA: DnaJ domain-containing protein [Anaeromyxobacteraceae bacterium]